MPAINNLVSPKNSPPIKLGVSSCLTGQCVRYDGGHKYSPYIMETLGNFFHLVPTCPEVEYGFPVPREPMDLVGSVRHPRLITASSGMDYTHDMQKFCARKVGELEKEHLSGFILKSNSPSCGLFRVPSKHPPKKRVKLPGAAPENFPCELPDKDPTKKFTPQNGRGLFASALAEHFPHLPLEEEKRLNDTSRRENFLERVLGYKRWQDFLANAPNPQRLKDFHFRQKLLLISHSPRHHNALEKLTFAGDKLPSSQLFTNYETLYMAALSHHSTIKKNIPIIQKLCELLQPYLIPREEVELLEILRAYQSNLASRATLLTLINHYTHKYELTSLQNQSYLSPYPPIFPDRTNIR